MKKLLIARTSHMAELVEVKDTRFGKREKWHLKNGSRIDVAFEEQSCTLFVTDRNGHDIADMVSKYFELKKFDHELSGSIDVMSIEFPIAEKQNAIELIEQALD